MLTGRFFSGEFFRNHFVQWVFLLGFFLNMAALGFTAYFFRSENGSILLHSNVYLGIDLQSVSPWYGAYKVPAAGLVFLVIHAIWAYYAFYRRDRIFAHIILLSAVFLQVGVAISVASLILLNAAR